MEVNPILRATESLFRLLFQFAPLIWNRNSITAQGVRDRHTSVPSVPDLGRSVSRVANASNFGSKLTELLRQHLKACRVNKMLDNSVPSSAPRLQPGASPPCRCSKPGTTRQMCKWYRLFTILPLLVPGSCTPFQASTCRAGESHCQNKNNSGLYYPELRDICVSSGFNAIHEEFVFENWASAVRLAHDSLTQVVDKLAEMNPSPFPAHLHPNLPTVSPSREKRQATASTEKTPTVLPYELSNVLINEFLHFQALKARSELDSLVPLTSIRPVAEVEIFADGTKIFSNRGENITLHKVPLHPMLNVPYYERMAIFANALATSATPTIDETNGESFTFANTTLPQLEMYLAQAFEQIFEAIVLIRDVITHLHQNRLHPKLYNLLSVQTILTKWASNSKAIKADELMNMALAIPTTFYQQKDKTAKAQFLTLVPIISDKGIYKAYDVASLPTYHKGVVKNDWHRIKADDTLILDNEYESIAVRKESMACMQLPAYIPCDLCMLPHMEISEFNQCWQQIRDGTKKPEDVCPIEKVNIGYEESTRIAENIWAYSDPTPGTITQKCGDESTRFTMDTEGILRFFPNCSYTVTNGPFIQSQMPSNVNVIPNIGSAISEISDDDISDSMISKHFEKYDIWYVIGLSVSLFVALVSFCCYCYRTRRSFMSGYRLTLPASRAARRARGQMRRNDTRTDEIPDIIELEEPRPPRPNLVPILSNLNNALSGYIQTV